MARAKRTDRAEARRRHRAELGEPEPGTGDAALATRAAPAPEAPPRPPGITTAFRAAFRPLDLRSDLRSAPGLLRHRAFFIPVALTIGSTALAFVTGTSIEPGSSTEGADIVTVLSVFAFQYFVVAPPVGSAFLAGFLAPRASWLIGFVVGVVALICLAVIVYSPLFGQLAAGEEDLRATYVANAAAVAPVGAALFAAMAAWYRRFLNLANPNRGRPTPNQRARGRERTRPVQSRTSARRR